MRERLFSQYYFNKKYFDETMQEPTRKSLLNVLQNSLKVGGKKTFLLRVIYFGEYPVGRNDEAKYFQHLFETNIKSVNGEYCEEILSGFGMFYDDYFINIMEGPEETICKHLKVLFTSLSKNGTIVLGKMKILIVCHNILRRIFSSWTGKTTFPPKLLDKIDSTNDVEEITRQITNCILKLYKLCDYLTSLTHNQLRTALDNLSEQCQQFLPEYKLLEFLLETPALLDVKFYSELYGRVSDIEFYHEQIWPAPSDYVPYNIIGEDLSKKLLYKPKEEEKDDEEMDKFGEAEEMEYSVYDLTVLNNEN